MELLDNKKHLIILIPLFLFMVLSLTLFDAYWKIAIVLAIVSFSGCILIGTIVFIRITESTGENNGRGSFGISLNQVAEYKAAIGSIISKVEKILLFYCLTIIAGFFSSDPCLSTYEQMIFEKGQETFSNSRLNLYS